MAKSTCTACNDGFYSVGAFDMHREGSFYYKTRHCLSEQERLSKGMKKDRNGLWTTGTFDASMFARQEDKVAQGS